MLLLTGEYEVTLDEKNRISIPSRLRDQIDATEFGSNFYYTLNANRILYLYPDLYYQRIALAVVPGKVAPDEVSAFERVHFASAGRVELDRQGRVLLSEKVIRRAGLKERLSLLGVHDHLELWNQDEWEIYLEEHQSSQEQMVFEARQEVLRRERERAGL